MSGLAVPLPITVITRMLGMPDTDQARLKAWTDDLASVADNDPREEVLERAQQSLFALRDHVLAAVAERTRRPGPDLLSALIAAEDAGDRLAHDELFGMVQVLLIAGQETTTNLIGNALHALLEHPDALERLRAEPALMASAVEECARWDTPVQARTRVATADFELGGQPYRRGPDAVPAPGRRQPRPARLPGSGPLRHRADPQPPRGVSATASTTASGPPWPARRRARPWRACSPGGPGWPWRPAPGRGAGPTSASAASPSSASPWPRGEGPVTESLLARTSA